MRMGLREANQRFSEAIKAVREGQEIILTERGKPIAVISPLKRRTKVTSSIRRLEQAGFLRPSAKRHRLPLWNPRPILGKPLSETVSQDRDRVL